MELKQKRIRLKRKGKKVKNGRETKISEMLETVRERERERAIF